ncbi:MAG TPA: hypothetical protein VH302_09170 [Bryobacteraceae bacterium]|nr:hypothetical protein [Bryobacteraceae bacterium]
MNYRLPKTVLLIIALSTIALSPSYAQDDSRRKLQMEPFRQTDEDVQHNSLGCVSCHGMTEAPSMHKTGTVHLGCSNCHGGDPSVMKPEGTNPQNASYIDAKWKAHPHPEVPSMWKSSANPVRPYSNWLKESSDYIKFVNPGDLRVAEETCGRVGCHKQEVRAVQTSMMTHGAMLWQAALYNNGMYPFKNARFGESYSKDGVPQILKTSPAPSQQEFHDKGVLPQLEPLLRWEITQPGNVLRVFERGGGPRSEIGNPNPEEDPGAPDDKLSDRGFGTLLRTDPVFLGLQKTRLLDPLLSLPGTNDHPGDYRNSGCTACHVIYANDRDPRHSGSYSQYGNLGMSAQMDPTIPKNESGHPIHHEFTRAIPTSQCIVCHIHPGTNMVSSYLGYTWWDNESDGDKMYPKKQHNPSQDERFETWQANPESAAARGLWKDPTFLANTGSPAFNSQLKTTQFADFHGHGWIFRGVYKQDRKGTLLDANDAPVKKVTDAVHLSDIHVDKGMHCVDCHFDQDGHGNGKLYGETRNAVEIDCVDCHGTIDKKATLRTSAAAAPMGGRDFSVQRTPWGKRQFEWIGEKLYQRSMVDENREPWEVVQTLDTITPGNEHYNAKSRYAKAVLKDGAVGSGKIEDIKLAHSNSRMTCYTCHSSWTTSCFGCHLPMQANLKAKMLHNEGLTTRNYTAYNFEVLRNDIYMLGVDGTVTKNRVAPTRSTCAVVVSSQNANRDWLYYEQQTVSAEGFSGFGFSPYFPHTVRARETKNCTDCHVSDKGDNNAWMAQLLMQGTNLVNFMGRYVYIAEEGHGFEAVTVAEHDDPSAVFGSDLQKLVYSDDYDKLQKHHRELDEADHHTGNVNDVQMRGEYLYTTGKNGFRAYDIANIDNKNFSEKVNTAPVSPLGQRFYVNLKDATSLASPSTLALDPGRTHLAENEEGKVAAIYAFLYATDGEDGLVVIGNPLSNPKSPGVLTLLDGNPENNFLHATVKFNPENKLHGARRITIAGNYAYILCDRGLVVVDLSNPEHPQVTGEIGSPDLVHPVGLALQFRYAFVVDAQGFKVLDVTDLAHPKIVRTPAISLSDAHNVYVARTYAYVAGGKQGMVLVDIEKPEQPKVDQVFNANGELNDTRDIKLGMTAASAFAYIADGKNGLRIVQVIAPNDTPGYLGFSPRPTPKLIATYRTKGPAVAVSKGIDRDRGADESGNQLTVFNRRGSRPFNLEEMQRMYLRNGKLYTVTDTPPAMDDQFSAKR